MVLQTIFRGSVWVFSPCVQFRVGTKLSRLRNHSPSAHYQGWQWSIEWTTFCPQVLWVCPMKNVQLQVQEMRIWFEYLSQKFRFFKQTSGPSVVFFESNPPSRTFFSTSFHQVLSNRPPLVSSLGSLFLGGCATWDPHRTHELVWKMGGRGSPLHPLVSSTAGRAPVKLYNVS